MSQLSRKMTRRSFATLAVGVPGVAMLYACTPGEPAPPSPTANVAFTQRQDSGGGESAATAAPAEATSSLPPVAVEGGDLFFNPTTFTAEQGQTIALTNSGALPHNFAIEGYNDAAPVDMPNGQTANWVVPADLAPGDYTFYCEIPGHREAGMVGTVTITAGGTTPAAGAAPALPPVALEGGDLYFEPTQLSVEVGQSISLTNVGALPHNFAIEGYNDAAPVDMPNGQTVDWPVPADVAPGDYVFYCEIPGHREAGMVGNITILAAGSTAAAAPAGTPEAGETPVAEGTPESGATPVSGTPESGTPVATTGQAPAAGASTSVSVSMVDLKFEPADVTIPANTDVTVTVTNNGALDHNWDVLGTAFKTEIAGGGDVQTITVNLAAGSYDLQCDVPGHAQAGMIGKLTVQ